jgi:multidrug efflux pump subunit AcrA (membrane-fusion protein)
MFARVQIPGKIHQNAIVVPEAALVLKEDQKTVFVVNQNNQVEQRLLQLGYVEDGFAEVLDGLRRGERIVVGGMNKLKEGVKVEAPQGGE